MRLLWRRTSILLLENAEHVFRKQPAPAALLVDLEGTITGFSPPQDSVAEALRRFDGIAAENGFDISEVHYVTNTNFKGLQNHLPAAATRIHTNAHKPLFTPPSQLQRRSTVVLGDQYFTDGLLAWRYRFTFGLVKPPAQVPIWPRVLLLLGRAVSSLFFQFAEQGQRPESGHEPRERPIK